MAKNTLITYDNLSAYTENIKSKFAPKVHTATTSTYGLATTSAYGHVKISNGDTVTAETANGIAAGMGHTHGNLALKTHAHGNISSEGIIAGAVNRVVITDGTGKITSSSTVTTTELDTLNIISGNTSKNSFSANRIASATSSYSFAEGKNTQAEGVASHAEGWQTLASGEDAHSEGYGTEAIGTESHAEGYITYAGGYSSHAEGEETYAIGNNSHSEGVYTYASGTASHAEGWQAVANGDYSHAEGEGTYAVATGSHACGRYNKYGDTANLFTIGNGYDDNNRSNAFIVDNDGYGYFAGDICINTVFNDDGTPIDGVWVSELGGGSSGDYAPTVHTATTSTYGLGTTSAYGHVKINNGDVATVASANGLAAGMNHSHSNYATTSHTHISNNITDAISTSGAITPVSTSLVEGKAVFDYHTTSNNYGNLFPNGIIFNSNDWVGDGATTTLSENNTILRGTSSSTSAYPRLRGVGFANITFEVGKQYTLSFIARSSAPFTLGYAIDKNDGGYSTLAFGNIKTTTSWKKYSLTATAKLSGSTVDGYGLQLYIAPQNVKEANRWTEFKEIRLEETNHVSTSGSTMYGKLIMGGQNTSNSVNSLGQIVFGDTTSSVALTSNGNGNLIVNPSTASTSGQIILKPGSSPSITVGGTAVSLSTHTHGNISSAGVIAGAASRVVVTDANGKITSSSTITTTELGYLDGVTSAIQTQINGKAASSHAHGNVSSAGVIAGAANSVVVTDANGKITSSSTITTTELGYLDNVSGAIQTQLNNKLSLEGGTMTGSIITPKDDSKGIIPHTNNYGSIGLSNRIFYNVYSNRIYATAITENGTALSSKYAPINHTHPNTGGGTATPTISYHEFNMIYATDYPATTTVGSTSIKYNSSVGISYDTDLFGNSEKVQYNIVIETGSQASSAMKGIVLDIDMDDKTQGVPHFITVSSSVGSCVLMRINIHDDFMNSDTTFCKTTTKLITGGTGLKSGQTTSLFAPNTIYTNSSSVSEIRETSRLFINTNGNCTGHCMFYNQTNNATGAVTYMMIYNRYFGTYDNGSTSYIGNAGITLTQL